MKIVYQKVKKDASKKCSKSKKITFFEADQKQPTMATIQKFWVAMEYGWVENY